MKMEKLHVFTLIFICGFVTCGNNSQQARTVVNDSQPVSELSEPDTTSSVQKEVPEVEEIIG